MSFPDTLTLVDNTSTNVIFTKTSDDASKTVYTSDESTIGLPTQLTILHQIAKPGVSGTDRHTVKYSKIAADDSNRLYTLPISLSIGKPRLVISDDDVDSAIAQIKSFLTAANLLKLLKGEC